MNFNQENGYFVNVSRLGLTVGSAKRCEVFSWLSDDDWCAICGERENYADSPEHFQAAIDALNSDGWHFSWHETESDALEFGRAGIRCHGQIYYAPDAENEEGDEH
jgi:hypothetical protein